MTSLQLQSIVAQLEHGTLTSESLVDYYLNRIKSHDIYYNSIASINPFARIEAKQLDDLRKQGTILSPLHGVPILIKDNIDCIHMPNTANSFLLKDHYPKEDAPIIKQLKDKGMIILGKTNLSEWAYFMSDDNMPSGYGSLHGQVKHPYREDIDPLGSSTGSAVSVALDFAPLSIGTETNGSLIAPAYQCGIVSLRPTFQLLSNQGIIPISPTQDTAGPMGRSVYDVSLLFDILTNQTITKTLNSTEHVYKIGIFHASNIEESDEIQSIYSEFKDVMTKHGHEVIDIRLDEYLYTSNTQTLYYEMKSSIQDYFKTHDVPFIKNLNDIIKLNKELESRNLKYGQTLLERSEETSGDLFDPEYIASRTSLLEKASIFNTLLLEHHVDALVSVHWFSESPIFGQPSIVVPAKTIVDNNPISLVFIGKKLQEDILIRLAHHYETSTQKRKDPMLT